MKLKATLLLIELSLLSFQNNAFIPELVTVSIGQKQTLRLDATTLYNTKNLALSVDVKKLYNRAEELIETEVGDFEDVAGVNYASNCARKDRQIRMTVIFLLGEILDADENKLESLALTTEMAHIASVLYDNANYQHQGKTKKNHIHNEHIQSFHTAGGDFMMAKAILKLHSIKNHYVEICMKNAMSCMKENKHLISDLEGSNIASYSHETYCKTAALFMQSCMAVYYCCSKNKMTGITSKLHAVSSFGYHFGMCLQITNDLHQFLNGHDIKRGKVTAPLLYTHRSQTRNSVQEMFYEDRYKFKNNIIAEAKVHKGIFKTRELAKSHLNDALDSLLTLEDSVYKDKLLKITNEIPDAKRM
tara:strand:+ start:486 stop:1565 length:1080 start_codon:yes stop_codon:yes gene_type:complete